uniref:Putative secreted protein n=1 Tax=Anopheles darlingi TaxID=43151 RepID=A0A2M4DRP1_ANODA
MPSPAIACQSAAMCTVVFSARVITARVLFNFAITSATNSGCSIWSRSPVKNLDCFINEQVRTLLSS